MLASYAGFAVEKKYSCKTGFYLIIEALHVPDHLFSAPIELFCFLVNDSWRGENYFIECDPDLAFAVL